MLYGNRRALDALGAASVLALAGLAYLFAWEPARRVSAATQARLEEARVARLRLTDVTLALTRANLSLDQARSELQAMPRLESARRLNSRLRRIGEIAEGSGVTIVEVLPGQTKSQARLIRIPVRLSGRASYVDFSGFLSTLHSQLPDLVIEKLRIEAGRTRDASDSFTLEIVWTALRDQTGSPDVPR